MTRLAKILLALGLTVAGGVLIYRSRKAAKASPAPRQAPGAPQTLPGRAEGPVLFLGDSQTASGYWKGIPGAIGEGWTGQQVRAVLKKGASYLEKKPRVVVFWAGVNDAASGRTAKQIGADWMAAWKAAHDAGAKVVAITVAPWASYSTSTAAKQDVTRKANAFMHEAKTLPGGPDVVIDLADMGDADGKLLPQYSRDGLHMSAAGYAEVERRVREVL